MMAYRGEDLELRTSQGWSAGAGAGDAGVRGRGYGTRGPIWVDDTVLASANHAFDVALAHRAGEVRTEHLLYALTRIEAAAELIEKRGVRVASLRREAATIIASDIPIGLAIGSTAVPRRSEPFEEALRLAAAEAGRRNGPATPDDLLAVFLDIRPDLPGSALLARHTLRVPRELPEPMAPFGRTLSYEMRPAEPVEPVRERVRMPAGSYYVSDAARASRSDLAAGAPDTAQQARLDALEQMVRTLAHDIGGERRAFAGMLQDMQRDFMAQRDDAIRLGGGLHERLQSVEHVLSAGRGGEGGGSQLMDRFQALEMGLDKRLVELSRSWAALTERLGALEAALNARAAPDLSPIGDRLDVIEEALLSPDRGGTSDTADRLAAIERLVQSERAEIIAETEVLKADIAALTALVLGQSGGTERLGDLAGLLDRGRGETVAAVTGPLLQRLDALAKSTEARHAEATGVLTQLSDRMAAAERALTLAVQRSEESQKAYAQELAELHDALTKLNTNQHTLAGSIDAWRTHGSSELSLVAKRLEGVEREAAKPLPMIEQMSASMEAMHRITVARHHRRNRFWYWLLGTDDWVAASWPSQLSKIEAERNLVKPVRR